MSISCKTTLFFTASTLISPSIGFSSLVIPLRSDPSKTKLKMGIFENIPTIMDSDASTTFQTLGHLVLDVGTEVIDPEETAILQSLESIGQVFGFLSYCAKNGCIQSDELIYHAMKISFSILVLFKTIIPNIKAVMNLMINPACFSASSSDKQAYEDLFEPIGLSWMDYNTLKYNGAFEWITLNPNEKILLSDCSQDKNRGTNLKDLTKKALEQEIYWLYEGSTNDENINNIIFASSILQSANKDPADERNIVAGDNGATILKINSDKILKLVENDAKLESCMQSLIFIGACQELNQPSNVKILA